MTEPGGLKREGDVNGQFLGAGIAIGAGIGIPLGSAMDDVAPIWRSGSLSALRWATHKRTTKD